MDCIYVKDAKYVRDYIVFLEFSDGRSGDVDLRSVVYQHDVAAPLRDVDVFSRFHLDGWPTLAWDCGFDIAPESLHERCGRTVASMQQVADGQAPI